MAPLRFFAVFPEETVGNSTVDATGDSDGDGVGRITEELSCETVPPTGWRTCKAINTKQIHVDKKEKRTAEEAFMSAAALAALTRSFLMRFLRALVPSGFDPDEAVFFIASSSAMAAVAVRPRSFICASIQSGSSFSRHQAWRFCEKMKSHQK